MFPKEKMFFLKDLVFVMVFELPEKEFVRRTFVVREMDFPPKIKMTRRSLLRWFALSFGLISEKESRSTVLDVLDALFFFIFSKKRAPSTKEIQLFVKQKTGKTISEKLLRYHLNKLIGFGLIQRKKNLYAFNDSPDSERGAFKESFEYWFSNSVQKALERNAKAFGDLAELYKKS